LIPVQRSLVKEKDVINFKPNCPGYKNWKPQTHRR
jgi:hypothetical protein